MQETTWLFLTVSFTLVEERLVHGQVEAAGDGAKAATGTVTDGAKAATDAVTDGAKKAADTVTDGAKKATEAIGNLFK